MKNSNAVIIPYCLVLLQGVLYGFGDPISKAAYEVMPVYSLLTVRYLIATCFLMLFFAKPVLRGLKESSVREWMLPSVCIAAGNIALDLTAATTVAFLRSLLTVMTPILAFICYKKKYYWSHLPILVAVVIGMYLLCGNEKNQFKFCCTSSVFLSGNDSTVLTNYSCRKIVRCR